MVLLNLIKAGGVGRWEWFKWQDKDRHIGVCWSRCHSSDDPPPLKPPLCFNLIQLYNHTLYSIHFNPLYLKLYPDLQPATSLKALQSSLWALCHILHQASMLQTFNCKPFEILIQRILSNCVHLQQTELLDIVGTLCFVRHSSVFTVITYLWYSPLWLSPENWIIKGRAC